MFTRWTTTTALLLCLAIVQSCADNQVPGVDPGADHVALEAELAASNQPYLIFDCRTHSIDIALGGTILRQLEFSFADSDSLLTGWPLSTNVDHAHLEAAVALVPEDELSVVSQVTGASPGQIQRYLPAEMLLVTSAGSRILIRTGLDGHPISSWGNFCEAAKSAISSLLGGRQLNLTMKPDDAMALYGLSNRQPVIFLRDKVTGS
ncbi:MAG: hypothetical protein ABIJ61_03930 [bacterium]